MIISGNVIAENKVIVAHGYTMLTTTRIDGTLQTAVTTMYGTDGKFVKVTVSNASASAKVWRSMGKDFRGGHGEAEASYKHADIKTLINLNAQYVMEAAQAQQN